MVQSIRVDNVAPVLTGSSISSDGSFLKLSFSETLDTIPDISDYVLTVNTSKGQTNTILLNSSNLANDPISSKSEISVNLDLPIFKDDVVSLEINSGSLSKYKDLVGKNLTDPGTVTVTNGSATERSKGTVMDGLLKGSTVFHDRDFDGVKDANETFCFNS